MIKYLVLMMFTLECSAADVMTGTSKWSIMHPDEVASTSKAVSKLGSLIMAYRCGTADEDKKDARCDKAKAAKDTIEEFGVENINFDDILYAVSTDGEQLGSGASAVATHIKLTNAKYSGRTLSDIMVDVGPMFIYAWGN
ncbi:hypothetical protein IIE18_13495 [Pseudomonas sp. V1]|uniref:hypothetical protein n=1 Tax=Pseudomonas arcuscaelestis TaxID=2710591 RepID=UPI00193FA6F3|nr:hypothetical protein [Pseudomonas arcuscaelestis]MBM3106150.1 hypothetical protein [Pseudomonas arcuscaelestis]